jgi:hypothetical protein
MAFLRVVLERMQRKDVNPHGFRSSFRDWVDERTHTHTALPVRPFGFESLG